MFGVCAQPRATDRNSAKDKFRYQIRLELLRWSPHNVGQNERSKLAPAFDTLTASLSHHHHQLVRFVYQHGYLRLTWLRCGWRATLPLFFQSILSPAISAYAQARVTGDSQQRVSRQQSLVTSNKASDRQIAQFHHSHLLVQPRPSTERPHCMKLSPVSWAAHKLLAFASRTTTGLGHVRHWMHQNRSIMWTRKISIGEIKSQDSLETQLTSKCHSSLVTGRLRIVHAPIKRHSCFIITSAQSLGISTQYLCSALNFLSTSVWIQLLD